MEKGIITLVENSNCENMEFFLGKILNGFELSIAISDDKTLEKQLKNKEAFDEHCIDSENAISDDDPEYEALLYMRDNFDKLFDYAEYVELNFSTYNNLEYIKNNPMLLTKKIIIDEQLDVYDYDRILELLKEYNDVKDNIYIKLIGNYDYISLTECYGTIKAIKEQAEVIKSLNLSPMETIMYVYDKVKNRVYSEEGLDESGYKSRDLKEVIFGDKIVCVGYANLFCAYLTYLGIRTDIVNLTDIKNPQEGHARSVAYIKDPKYNIDGVYYFDPTWDSRIPNEGESYLNRYTFFARTRETMDTLQNYKLIDDDFPYNLYDLESEFGNYVRERNAIKAQNLLSRFNYMAAIAGFKGIDTNCYYVFSSNNINAIIEKTNNFKKLYKKVLPKFRKEIPAETMIELLNNVRKVEHYYDPLNYPYTTESIIKSALISEWNFKNNYLSNDINYALRVRYSGDLLKHEINKNNCIEYIEKLGLRKQIKETELTKVLRLTYNKKNN